MARLGTAQWADPAFVENHYLFRPGTLWLGRSASDNDMPLGYVDDRHICLVSGSRGGKGTSTIITNLCLWPGSLVVVDPKGENATVTVARRGKGTEACEGMGQRVHVLDPFRVVQVDDDYRARFNPLDALDPEDPETIEKAGTLADSIVIVRDEAADPFWDMSGRQMVKALILHIVTAPEYEGRRNLVTLRSLIQTGYKEAFEALQSMGEEPQPPHELLWEAVARNEAFGGRVGKMGETFANMLSRSGKQYESVLQVANRNTEFLDSPAMEECVSSSDFKLSDLKTDPQGVSVFLSLPQRFMNTHNRWLRMMVGLMLMKMEIVARQPACGHPVLIVLDEFAGMKRMESIETGVAHLAGYGVKLFFVLQSLEQLKAVYKDWWQTFLTNCGLKLFFSIDDNFSREEISKLIGETEVMRNVRSAGANSSQSDSLSESSSESVSESTARSRSESEGRSLSFGQSVTEGTSRSTSRSATHGENKSHGSTLGESHGSSSGTSWSGPNLNFNRSRNDGSSFSSTTTEGTSDSWSVSETDGTSRSTSKSVTEGTSLTRGTSESETHGETRGATRGETHGVTRGETSGTAETVHKRPLCTPDEVGKLFSRIDDRGHGAYPGYGLALMAGQDPVPFRRVNYYQDPQFIGYFGPHPDHKYLPPVVFRVKQDSLKPFEGRLSMTLTWQCTVSKGDVVRAGDVLAWVVADKPLPIRAPGAGRISSVPMKMKAAPGSSALQVAFSSFWKGREFGDIQLLYYNDGAAALDPFAEIEAHCRELEDAKQRALEDDEARQARAATQYKAEAAEQDEQADISRMAALRESGRRWLKGAGVAGLLLAGDIGVTAFTHAAAAGIVIGIGVAAAAGFCGVKAFGRYSRGWDIETKMCMDRNNETMETFKKTGRI